MHIKCHALWLRQSRKYETRERENGRSPKKDGEIKEKGGKHESID